MADHARDDMDANDAVWQELQQQLDQQNVQEEEDRANELSYSEMDQTQVQPGCPFKLKDIVLHPDWGEGKVIGLPTLADVNLQGPVCFCTPHMAFQHTTSPTSL
jgi:hypothetical protein